MYEIVYSKNGKKLKDDKRLTYYSFYSVIEYPEVIRLCIFSIMYSISAGMNVELAHPFGAENVKWPFARYAEGAFCGLMCVIFFSDLIF